MHQIRLVSIHPEGPERPRLQRKSRLWPNGPRCARLSPPSQLGWVSEEDSRTVVVPPTIMATRNEQWFAALELCGVPVPLLLALNMLIELNTLCTTTL